MWLRLQVVSFSCEFQLGNTGVIGSEEGETDDCKKDEGRGRNQWEQIRRDGERDHLLWIFNKGKRERRKKEGWKKVTQIPLGVNKSLHGFSSWWKLEVTWSNSEEQWILSVRVCGSRACRCVCVSREAGYGWPGRHCAGWHGWQSPALLPSELENTFSLRRLPLSRPDAHLLWR